MGELLKNVKEIWKQRKELQGFNFIQCLQVQELYLITKNIFDQPKIFCTIIIIIFFKIE